MQENDQTSETIETPQFSETVSTETPEVNIDLDIPSPDLDFGDYVKEEITIERPRKSEE